jgi:hypothetical protein
MAIAKEACVHAQLVGVDGVGCRLAGSISLFKKYLLAVLRKKRVMLP